MSRPFSAMEIVPVSSLTTKIKASHCSERPIAARWRVPSSLERPAFSVSGSKQPADNNLFPRMIAAPSCKGVLTKKIFPKSSAVILASSFIPVSLMSFKPIRLSITKSAPVFVADSDFAAVTISLIIFFASSSSSEPGTSSKINLPWPSFSRVRRSSGWKTIGRATKTHVINFSKSHDSSGKLKSVLHKKFARNNTKIPLAKVIARVPSMTL